MMTDRLTTIRGLLFLVLIFILFMIIKSLGGEFISNLIFPSEDIILKDPEKGSKILIIAPHNDDESLGASIFIKRNLENGCDIKVIMITNGDGYTEAIEVYDKEIFVKREDYIKFGYQRQGETIDAMTSIGVKKEDIYFLGYPDGGISHLWMKNFHEPYTSKFTKSNKSPYNNSFTPNTEYTGKNLVSDLEQIIFEYKPDYIVYPHPNDRHPDHYSTNAFVKYVLSKMSYKPKEELLYLVHRGDWPVPLMLNPKQKLKPPYKLEDTGTIWYTMYLSPEDIAYKEDIIRRYKTQFPTLESLMLAFVRQNELFGLYPDMEIKKYIHSDIDIIPREENLIIKDPAQDSIRLGFSKSSDLIGIYGEISKEENLHIIIETDGDMGEFTTYKLDIIIFKEDRQERIVLPVKDGILQTSPLDGEKIEGVSIKTSKNLMHIIMPFDRYQGYKSFLINGSTYVANGRIDRTAYRLIK